MKATDVAPSRLAAAVSVTLDRLATSPGTALGEAIFTALNALPSARTTTTPATTKAPAASIVLLSDGKSTTGRSDNEAIAAAKAANIPVSTIAFGTANATVESAGRTVHVPVDSSALEAIATGSGGKFFTAASADQLRAVYADINADVTSVPIDRSVAVWFSTAALALLLAASLTSMLRTGRVVFA